MYRRKWLHKSRTYTRLSVWFRFSRSRSLSLCLCVSSLISHSFHNCIGIFWERVQYPPLCWSHSLTRCVSSVWKVWTRTRVNVTRRTWQQEQRTKKMKKIILTMKIVCHICDYTYYYHYQYYSSQWVKWWRVSLPESVWNCIKAAATAGSSVGVRM